MHLPLQLRYTVLWFVCFINSWLPLAETFLLMIADLHDQYLITLRLLHECSQVDPIVASFSGGAVGVISVLMLIEVNNVEQQEKKRCKYCHGTGMFLLSEDLHYFNRSQSCTFYTHCIFLFFPFQSTVSRIILFSRVKVLEVVMII